MVSFTLVFFTAWKERAIRQLSLIRRIYPLIYNYGFDDKTKKASGNVLWRFLARTISFVVLDVKSQQCREIWTHI